MKTLTKKWETDIGLWLTDIGLALLTQTQTSQRLRFERGGNRFRLTWTDIGLDPFWPNSVQSCRRVDQQLGTDFGLTKPISVWQWLANSAQNPADICWEQSKPISVWANRYRYDYWDWKFSVVLCVCVKSDNRVINYIKICAQNPKRGWASLFRVRD